jgi:hypothetical protein
MKGATPLNTRKTLAFVAAYWVALSSCHRATPAGFWLDFRKDLLVRSVSDQGSYGGKREIFWKSSSNKHFSPEEFIEFATRNGWQLADSIFIPFERMKRLTNNNTFPFTYSGFSDSSFVDVGFSNQMNSAVELYRFETGWITIEPGSEKETDKNGYIVFKPDGSEVAVYHLWGE